MADQPVLPVLLAVTGQGEARLVAALDRPALGLRVVRRCADLAELLAAAATGLARAAIVSADLGRLDREAVARLRGAGVAVVGLAGRDDPAAVPRLRLLGVVEVLPADAAPERVAERLFAAVAAGDDPGHGRPGWSGSRPQAIADPADALPAVAGSDPTVVGAEQPDPDHDPAESDGDAGYDPPRAPAGSVPGSQGRIIAVWGPVGAPGRTSVAIGVASELARLGEPTLLLDADTYGPSIAQSLALLDESAGLAAAVRAANQGLLDPARLTALAVDVLPGLRLLTGIPHPSRWPELRASGLELVWQCARQVAGWTVVDCGFGLETDEEVCFDAAAPRRNGATLSALQAADVVLAVGCADPIGLQRFVRGWQDLAALRASGAQVHAVVTRVRSAAVGADPERQVARTLARYAGVTAPVLIPDDRPAYDSAMLAGRTLLEVAPQSRARQALAGLAADLAVGAGGAAADAGPPGRRWRRAPASMGSTSRSAAARRA